MVEKITEFRGDYKFLSNFSFSPFKAAPFGVAIVADPVYDLTWRTVEHYFQGSKATSFPLAKKICNAHSPRHAKFQGSKVKLREDWEAIKNEVMLAGLRYKFTIALLKEKLLATGEAELIEGNTWNDRYWGCSPVVDAEGNITWVGENHLGKLLMQVRKELQ